jgi:hypothetical protein
MEDKLKVLSDTFISSLPAAMKTADGTALKLPIKLLGENCPTKEGREQGESAAESGLHGLVKAVHSADAKSCKNPPGRPWKPPTTEPTKQWVVHAKQLVEDSERYNALALNGFSIHAKADSLMQRIIEHAANLPFSQASAQLLC